MFSIFSRGVVRFRRSVGVIRGYFGFISVGKDFEFVLIYVGDWMVCIFLRSWCFG